MGLECGAEALWEGLHPLTQERQWGNGERERVKQESFITQKREFLGPVDLVITPGAG